MFLSFLIGTQNNDFFFIYCSYTLVELVYNLSFSLLKDRFLLETKHKLLKLSIIIIKRKTNLFIWGYNEENVESVTEVYV